MARKEYAHLPRWQQPGPQTLRGHGFRRSGFVIKAVSFIFILGAVPVYYLGMTCPRGEDECQPGLMFALAGPILLVGLLLFWLGWFLDKRKRRRNAAHLQLSLPRDVYFAGEAVSVRFEITNVNVVEGDVQVGLVCTIFYDYEYEAHTQHGTTTSRQIQTGTSFETWLPAQRTMGAQELNFTIPADAPYSHEGKAVSFAWKVSARESRSGFDRFTDLPIWVETWV
jgi:hypothetical protein